MAYDAIIIGAGMSGLAAGIRLAMYDKRVLILERHYTPGGLNSYYHRLKRPFDVGLHAMTNYVPKGTKRAPLTKITRQLRIPYDAFQLREQHGSRIHFPQVQLDFSNDFAQLREAVHTAFPAQADGFDALTARVEAYDSLSLDARPQPSRPILEEHISHPLLIDMLYCPLMYYGSAEENEMEFGQFCIMFQSIFREGFARSEGGVRTVIKALVDRYQAVGGELRYQAGVERVLSRDGKVTGVLLEAERGVTKTRKKNRRLAPRRRVEDEVIEAPVVISSAGWLETLDLLAPADRGPEPEPEVGQLTFVESIMCLDTEPGRLGIDKTIVFYNDSERFDYRRADDYCDLRSGVICCTNNYHHDTPLPEGLLRITSIASWDKWSALEKPEPYEATKQAWLGKQVEKSLTMLPDYREHVVADDVFTPTTIHHFTRHRRGAIYGAPQKVKTGLMPLEGLFLCGTDQGFLGIVGAMLSGISIANARVLQGGG